MLPREALPAVCHDLYGQRADEWPTPQVVIGDERAAAPDVWWLSGAGTIAIELHIADELQPFLAMAGELLPVAEASGETRHLHALNVLNVVDALDLSRSDPELLVIYPDFIERRLGEPTLFMVPQLLGMFFCIDWEGDDSLKRRIDAQRVVGLRFKPVWTSHGGGSQLNLMRSPRSSDF